MQFLDCHLIYANIVQNKDSLNFLLFSVINRKKPSELLVFNVEMFIQTLFSIGIKLLNYQTKSLLKIAFLSVNLLVLIFHQFSIIGLPFPQTLIGQKHPVLQKHS